MSSSTRSLSISCCHQLSERPCSASPPCLRAVRANAHCTALHLQAWQIIRTAGAHDMKMHAGDISALPPVTYGIGSATSALRQLSAARHVGKIVVADPSNGGSTKAGCSQGCWVISGGTGALGALAAKWLAAAGARHIALLGRTGRAPPGGSSSAPASSADAATNLMEATAGGMWAASVKIVMSDVAVATDAACALSCGMASDSTGTAAWRQQCLPLAGVLHAGGVLADATIQNQTLAGWYRIVPSVCSLPRTATAESPVLPWLEFRNANLTPPPLQGPGRCTPPNRQARPISPLQRAPLCSPWQLCSCFHLLRQRWGAEASPTMRPPMLSSI